MEYSFSIKHIKGSSNCTADSLSRLPVCDGVQEDGRKVFSQAYPEGRVTRLAGLPSVQHVEVLREDEDLMAEVQELAQYPQETMATITISQIVGQEVKEAWDILPLTLKDVATATRDSRQYGKLFNAVRSGVLDHKDPDLKKFSGVFQELYIEDDVIYFGSRVVIPTKQQLRLLTELHYSHIGIVRMKETVRKYFWWPAITKDIEVIAANCEGCRRYRKRPPLGHSAPGLSYVGRWRESISTTASIKGK